MSHLLWRFLSIRGPLTRTSEVVLRIYPFILLLNTSPALTLSTSPFIHEVSYDDLLSIGVRGLMKRSQTWPGIKSPLIEGGMEIEMNEAQNSCF